MYVSLFRLSSPHCLNVTSSKIDPIVPTEFCPLSEEVVLHWAAHLDFQASFDRNLLVSISFTCVVEVLGTDAIIQLGDSFDWPSS